MENLHKQENSQKETLLIRAAGCLVVVAVVVINYNIKNRNKKC